MPDTRKTSNQLKPILLSEPPKVLFLGNGINLLFPEECVSWDKLMDNLGAKSIPNIDKLPYYLKAQLLRNKSENNKSKSDYTGNIHSLCLNWCNEIIGDKRSSLIKKLIDGRYESVITTNYSYEIEKSLNIKLNRNFEIDSYKLEPTIKKNNQTYFFHKYRHYSREIGSNNKVKEKIKKQEKILRCYSSPEDNGKMKEERLLPYVWHIHGEAEKYKEIVLDLYSYGKNLSVIQRYISKFIERVLRAVNSNDKKNIKLNPLSWIDYFLLGEIDIVGFSFDYSEFDLWWLLNERIRVIDILKKRLGESLKLTDNQNTDQYLKFGSVTFYDADVLNIYNTNNKDSFSNENKKDSSLKAVVLSHFNCVYQEVKLSSDKITIESNSRNNTKKRYKEYKNISEEDKKLDSEALAHNLAVYEKIISAINKKTRC